MTRSTQRRVIEHALSLDQAYTPRLDSMDHHLPFMRQTMSMHVIQVRTAHALPVAGDVWRCSHVCA